MANEEHLKQIKGAIEKQDIEIWNRWRRENSDTKLDFNKANLCGADLKVGAINALNRHSRRG